MREGGADRAARSVVVRSRGAGRDGRGADRDGRNDLERVEDRVEKRVEDRKGELEQDHGNANDGAGATPAPALLGASHRRMTVARPFAPGSGVVGFGRALGVDALRLDLRPFLREGDERTPRRNGRLARPIPLAAQRGGLQTHVVEPPKDQKGNLQTVR